MDILLKVWESPLTLILFGYLLLLTPIRVKLFQVQNREIISRCIRLPKILKYFLFLPLPFVREDEVFPIHTVVFTSLIHIGFIAEIVATFIIYYTAYTVAYWFDNAARAAFIIGAFAWGVELLILGGDVSVHRSPKNKFPPNKF